jgi:hypothetical protein
MLLHLALTLLASAASVAVVRRFTAGALRLSERMACALFGVMAWTVAQALCFAWGWRGYTRTAIVASDLLVLLPTAILLRRHLLDEVDELRARVAGVLADRTRLHWLFAPALAALVWFGCMAYTWKVPFPGVDAAGYHLPAAIFIAQEHTIDYFPARNGHVNNLPHHGQFNFSRAFALGADERSVRPMPFMFGIAAVLMIYAWARHLGVSGRIAAAVAPMWWLVPGVVNQQMFLWGTVDLTYHSLWIACLSLLSRAPDSRAMALCRGGVVAVLAGLLMGTRGQGLVMGPLMVFGATLRVAFAQREGWFRTSVRFAAVAGAATLLLGAQMYVFNSIVWQNPLYPIQIRIGDRLVADAPFKTVHHLIGTKVATGTRDMPEAMINSWKVLFTYRSCYIESRLGGWGPAWMFAMIPGCVAGVALCAWKRRWDAVIIAVLVDIHLHTSPDMWWVRFALHSFAGALAFTAVAIQWLADRPGWRPWRLLALGWLQVLSFLAGAEAFYVNADHNNRGPYHPADGKWLHSLDTIRPRENETRLEHELYFWCRDNLPEGSRLVYFHEDWQWIMHYFMYRHDLRNYVAGEGRAGTVENMNYMLDKYRATHFVLQPRYDPRIVLKGEADAYGRLLWHNERFYVYERIKPGS